MIKTKIAFKIFSILLIFLFPFSLLMSLSDYTSSIIPGWNTTIYPKGGIITIVKFIILIFVIFGYYKLQKTNDFISKNIYIIHLILTIPSIIISKFSLFMFVDYNTNSVEKISNDFYVLGLITIFINIMFFLGQIMFGVYFFKNKSKVF